MEVTFDIRKARTEDAGEIVEVLEHAPFVNDCYRGEAGISLIETRLNLIWLADLNGRIASLMMLLHKDDLGLLEISLSVTKPEFRRRGFARDLIHKGKQIARDSRLDLVAHPENNTSRELLISEQFTLVLRRQNLQGNPMYRFSRKLIEPIRATRPEL
jgi:ribosomal protein S18 acetylase RimI-like enzyme